MGSTRSTATITICSIQPPPQLCRLVTTYSVQSNIIFDILSQLFSSNPCPCGRLRRRHRLIPYAARVASWVCLLCSLQSRLPEHTRLPHSACLQLINLKFTHTQYFALKAFCFHLNTLISFSSTTTVPAGPLSHERLLIILLEVELYPNKAASFRSCSTLSSALAHNTLVPTVFCNAFNDLHEHEPAH